MLKTYTSKIDRFDNFSRLYQTYCAKTGAEGQTYNP